MNLQVAIVPAATTAGLGSVLDERNRFDLCVTLTALLLLLYAPDGWYAEIPLSLVAMTGLVFPELRKSAILWGAATSVVAFGVFWKWHIADNHKYLLVYWCLAIFLALLTSAPERALKTSSRWLIALVFMFAVIQKTRSSDYLDGTFFYSELLLDVRFETLARIVGGVTGEFQSANQAKVEALRNFSSNLSSVQLQAASATNALAIFITWWNYLIQVVIAVLFLPISRRWRDIRNLALLLFLFTTYLFAPVIGFGWVLAVMGVAQTDPDQTRTRAAYLCAAFFLQACNIPWQSLLGRIFA
jgi:hypothetical protein